MAHERVCRWVCHACGAGGLTTYDKDATMWDLAHVLGDVHAERNVGCADRNGVALIQFERVVRAVSRLKPNV